MPFLSPTLINSTVELSVFSWDTISPMPKSLISRYQTNPKTKILILQREYTVPYSVPERTFCQEQVRHEQAVPQELSDQSRKISHPDHIFYIFIFFIYLYFYILFFHIFSSKLVVFFMKVKQYMPSQKHLEEMILSICSILANSLVFLIHFPARVEVPMCSDPLVKKWRRWFFLWYGWADKRCLALFPAGTIVRDPQHRESPPRREKNLKLRRTWVQALLNEVVQ